MKPLGVAALLAAACAGNRNAAVFVPASNFTVHASTEMNPVGDGQYVYVENNSSEPIVVTSVVLLECENTRPHCGPTAVRVRLQPGDRRNVLAIRPDNPTRAYSFRYSFAWQGVAGQ